MITLHFIAENDPATLGSATFKAKAGQSLMQGALAGGVDGIAADCGGSLTCATCHVMVREPWASQLPPPSAEERDMLAFTAVTARPNSRLSCQIQLTDALDGLTVDLPATQY
ncbi:MAG: (2Fe-2S)-binding protein [Burkholderiaceae bacterium]|nr:(2Fe-2S)-binding protein [Burkholderiaceae bacterium]